MVMGQPYKPQELKMAPRKSDRCVLNSPYMKKLCFKHGTYESRESRPRTTSDNTPSLPGTDKEVIVQPRLETRTCMVPLLSSKISAFGSAIALHLKRREEKIDRMQSAM